ncbi:Uncharacterised protein [Mycobacteroides abscessus subsp. abscessus]|nr:Uncharacterised protein [Mycobacteroides abscessus subsp. abscessus]
MISCPVSDFYACNDWTCYESVWVGNASEVVLLCPHGYK